MIKTTDSYESLYAELDENIASLQSGDLNLDEAVKKYERSIELIDKLEKYLKTVENKVTQIKNNLK